MAQKAWHSKLVRYENEVANVHTALFSFWDGISGNFCHGSFSLFLVFHIVCNKILVTWFNLMKTKSHSFSGRSTVEEGEGSDTLTLMRKSLVLRLVCGLEPTYLCCWVQHQFSWIHCPWGLDEVKGNLIKQGEEHKEGLTALEFKLTEAPSALHGELEALSQQMEETTLVGGHDPVTGWETCIEAPKPRSFAVIGMLKTLRTSCGKCMLISSQLTSLVTLPRSVWQQCIWVTPLCCGGGGRNPYEEGNMLRWWFGAVQGGTKTGSFTPKRLHEALRKLTKLKQMSSICDYVKEFTKLFFKYKFEQWGSVILLLGWPSKLGKQGLQRRQVNDVDEAVVVAESLTDFCPMLPKEETNGASLLFQRWIPIGIKAGLFPTRAMNIEVTTTNFCKNYEEQKKVLPIMKVVSFVVRHLTLLILFRVEQTWGEGCCPQTARAGYLQTTRGARRTSWRGGTREEQGCWLVQSHGLV